MPAQNRLVVPVAAQSLPVLPVAEPQASIGSMVAESAVLVALAEQEKAVVVAQVAAPADVEHITYPDRKVDEATLIERSGDADIVVLSNIAIWIGNKLHISSANCLQNQITKIGIRNSQWFQNGNFHNAPSMLIA